MCPELLVAMGVVQMFSQFLLGHFHSNATADFHEYSVGSQPCAWFASFGIFVAKSFTPFSTLAQAGHPFLCVLLNTRVFHVLLHSLLGHFHSKTFSLPAETFVAQVVSTSVAAISGWVVARSLQPGWTRVWLQQGHPVFCFTFMHTAVFHTYRHDGFRQTHSGRLSLP